MPQKYISPWQNAEAQRRRASRIPVHPIKRDNQTPTQANQYFVLGIEVDRNTYWKYEKELYQLTDDHKTSLFMVNHYATSKTLAQEFPKETEAAKMIVAQIREEITATMNRKDDENMSKPKTAADFISALNDIYTESRGIYDGLQDAVNKAKSKMDRAQEEMKNPACNRDIAEAQYAIARGEYQLAESERRNRSRTMQEEHAKKVAELRGQFVTYLNDHYSASPDKLDAATMQLLNSGICTPSELSRLVDRHADNPTMLRIIGNYARNMRDEKAKSMSYDDVNICASVANAALAAKDGSRELAIFDSAVSTMDYGLGSNYDHATRMHSHISGWLDDFKNQIVNLPNMPAEDNNNTEE